MHEHFNTNSGPSDYSLDDTIAHVIDIVGSDGKNSVFQHVYAAGENVANAQVLLGEVAQDSNSPVLADVYAANELVTLQLQKIITTVSKGAGDLAVYRRVISESQPADMHAGQRPTVDQHPNHTRGNRQRRRNRQHPGKDKEIVLAPTPVLRLTPLEAQSYIDTQRQFESLVPYNNLAMETAKAVRHGKREAFHIPAVQFVVDSVLAALSQGTVAARMPLEITDRSTLAMHDAHTIAEVATKTKLLRNFYRNNPYLQRITAANPDLESGLLDADYIGTLASAVFSDASFIASGALKAMQALRVPGNVRQLISESATLKSFAGIPKEEAHGLVIELGIPPDPQHYKITIDKGRIATIDFSDHMVARIRGLMGPDVGCPIRQLKSDEPHARTQLDYAWNLIIDFLVPPGATANNPPVKAFYMHKDGVIGS